MQYTPNPNFNGSDSFTYKGSDGSSSSTPVVVAIMVTPDAYTEVTNTCDSGTGSLRAASELANTTAFTDTIIFDLLNPPLCATTAIAVGSPLPAIVYPVVIDGTLNNDGSRRPEKTIVLDGGGGTFSGLVLLARAGGSTVRDLTIQHFGGSGILIGSDGASNDNLIQGNTIAFNGGGNVTITLPGSSNLIPLNDGITLIQGVNNILLGNDIHANAGLPVDLGGDGPSPNDADDLDVGANYVQNYPVLFRAVPTGAGQVIVEGWLDSVPSQPFRVQLFAGAGCDAGSQQVLPIANSADSLVTNELGEVYFQIAVARDLPLDVALRATATDAYGNTSEFSECILTSVGNDSWPRALYLSPGETAQPPIVQRSINGVSGRQQWTATQYLDVPGQSRWYRFPIMPDSDVAVALTGLPANYDLTLYKDVEAVYNELVAPQDANDLRQLSAEFAPAAFSPAAFSPAAFSPAAFSPAAFSPAAFSPAAFSPAAFSPAAFSPAAFSPAAFSADAYSPAAFSPAAFSPAAFSPAAFSPAAFSPAAFSPAAFSNAQVRSLIGVSAFEGTANEGLRLNTWQNRGSFYVRVRGRSGESSLASPFTLTVSTTPSGCDPAAFDALSPPSLLGEAGDYHTIILTDFGRMQGATGAIAQSLAQLAARPEVKGVVVDVSGDARVAAANSLADTDAYRRCPYAKNVVAQAAKGIVDRYRAAQSGAGLCRDRGRRRRYSLLPLP